MIQLHQGSNALAITCLITQIQPQYARLSLVSEATSNAVVDVRLSAAVWDGRVLRGTLQVNAGTHDPAAGAVELKEPEYPAGAYLLRVHSTAGTLWAAAAAWLERAEGEAGYISVQPYLNEVKYVSYEP